MQEIGFLDLFKRSLSQEEINERDDGVKSVTFVDDVKAALAATEDGSASDEEQVRVDAYNFWRKKKWPNGVDIQSSFSRKKKGFKVELAKYKTEKGISLYNILHNAHASLRSSKWLGRVASANNFTNCEKEFSVCDDDEEESDDDDSNGGGSERGEEMN